MAEQDQDSVTHNVPGFSESDAFAVSQLKETLNDVLPTAFPSTEVPSIEVNDNPYDEVFLSVVENYVLNDAITSDNPDLQVLKDQYFAVSDEGRARMESYSEYFLNDDASLEDTAKQAQKLIQKAQHALGGSHTNTEPSYSPEHDVFHADIDDVTVQALAKYIEQMKQENPDLVDEEFDVSAPDGKSLDFMNRLVSKRMDEAGVKPDDLNSTLIHLWALENNAPSDNISFTEEELAQTTSIRDLLGMMSNGKLPNGSDVRISVDDSLTGPVYTGTLTDDRFFSKDTYTAIMNDQEVPASTLFAENEGNPHFEDLKLAAEALGIDTENGTVTQEQVGQIAIRMLEYQACKLGIDKQDITAAINDGTFRPDLDDLRLVEVGLGLPPELHNQGLSAKDAFIAEFESMGKVAEYRNDRWEEEFGKMTEDAITERINIYLDGAHVDNAERRQYIRDNYTLPTKNYADHRFITGSENPTGYEIGRAEYLKENIEKLMPCVSDVQEDVNAPETKADAATLSDKQSVFSEAASAPEGAENEINAAINDATGSEAGTIPQETPIPMEPKPEQNAELSATQ